MYIMDFLCNPAQIAAVLGGIFLCKVLYSAAITQKKPMSIILPIMTSFVVIVFGVITVVNYSCNISENYLAWGLVGLLAVYLVNRLMRK
jgi:hypothetical protein